MNHPSSDAGQFVAAIAGRELEILEDRNVESALIRHFNTPNGLQKFAVGFYFIRVHFVKINFIIGARCPTHELYWAGLAHNLMEELGGESGPSHNELYRWFLNDAGIADENSLSCPKFAAGFDKKWEDYARNAPLEDALGAVAVYEIFDNPDYQMLLDVMSHTGVSERGLVFFKVHAKAAHFELFEDYFRHVSNQPGGTKALKKATDFVLETQKEMWSGLLDYLAAKARPRIDRNFLRS
jgi:pyrroloquinoline quinone (PQQ) biosynthesis protein C